MGATGARRALFPFGLAFLVAFSCSSSAFGEDATFLSERSESGARASARALARVKANRALRAARKDFAATKFSECESALIRAELELRELVRDPSDFELLKKVLEWTGLCQAVNGAADRARRSFALAGRLPGPEPDPEAFPPSVLELYRAATAREGRTCVLQDPGEPGGLRIDGTDASRGTSLQVDEHYWSREEGTALVLIDASCRPVPPPALHGSRIGVLTAVEEGDAELMRELAHEAGSAALLSVSVEGAGLAGRVFDARSSEWKSAGPTAAVSSSPTEPDEEGGAWYESGWVWALVGGGVVAAVLVPVMLSTRDSPEPSYRLSF